MDVDRIEYLKVILINLWIYLVCIWWQHSCILSTPHPSFTSDFHCHFCYLLFDILSYIINYHKCSFIFFSISTFQSLFVAKKSLIITCEKFCWFTEIVKVLTISNIGKLISEKSPKTLLEAHINLFNLLV